MDLNTLVLLFCGLIVLVVGGNLLLKSAVSISLKFGIPKILIGMTVVSLATSAPELIVSIKSALIGSTDLAISNVVGSNIANIGLVLGLTVFFSPINISKIIYKTLPVNDPLKRKPDISKAIKILNWKPIISRKEGLEQTFRHYKSILE